MSNESTRQAVGRGRAFWLEKIAEFERDPCAHAEFVERHGLMLTSFRSWLYRLRGEGTSWDGAEPDGEFEEHAVDEEGRFVEVVAGQARGLLATACTIEAGALRVHFREAPSAEYVAQLVREVG